jgi:hypothetical protein
MPLRATAVEKLNAETFTVHLSDGGYIVVSDKDMATILLSRKDKSGGSSDQSELETDPIETNPRLLREAPVQTRSR